MNQTHKPGYRHMFWYGLFGFAFGLAFVLIATLIVLYQTGTPLTLDAVVQTNLSNGLLLLIDTLPFIFAVLFGMLGRREDVHVARRNELSQTSHSQAGEIDRLNDEVAMLNEEMARQARESREAHAIVERGKRQWEATFDSVADLILLTDQNGQIVRCNQATALAFQADFNQILGMHVNELFFGSSGSEKTQFPAERAELQFPRLEGWYEVISNPLELEGGLPGKIYLIRNITDRKQATLSLDRQRQYYEVLVRDNPLAIATLNLELRVVDCNPAFEQLFGLSKKEMFGKSLDDVILPEGLEEEGRALSQTVLGGETVHQVTRRRLADGSLVDMQVFGMPVVLWGKQIGILAMYNDMTGMLQSQAVGQELEETGEAWVPEEYEVHPEGEGGAELAAAALAGAAVLAAQEGPGEETVEVVELPQEEMEQVEEVIEAKRKRLQVEMIEGIGPVYADKLAEHGISTTDELLQAGASRKGRQELADSSGISRELILKWVNRADLMRVPGVGEEYSDLLEAAGVDTVKELRKRNPENLHLAMAEVNTRKNLVRRLPHFSEVQAWVEAAKGMEVVVTY
jgi:PAS domain S-box-containing protein